MIRYHFHYKVFERADPMVGMLKSMTLTGINLCEALNTFYSSVKKDLDLDMYDFKITSYDQEEK